MKIVLFITAVMLAFGMVVFADENNTYKDTTMTTAEHRQAVDECVEAKIRAKLLDAGIVTKSTTTAVMIPGATAVFTSSTPQIAYDSQNGVVTLNGTVLSRDQEQRIVNLIDDIQGVQRVDSRLTYNDQSAQQNQAFNDTQLKDRIKNNLKEKNLYDPSSFKVYVDKGEVTITGNVASRKDANEIMSLIWGMDGVKDVNSRLVSRNGTTTFTNDPIDMSELSK
jgi:osmotically-inducible protein OsmY